jgi:hypothetical protein
MREHAVEVFLFLAASIHSMSIGYQKKNKDSVKNTSLYIKMVLRFILFNLIVKYKGIVSKTEYYKDMYYN